MVGSNDNNISNNTSEIAAATEIKVIGESPGWIDTRRKRKYNN